LPSLTSPGSSKADLQGKGGETGEAVDDVEFTFFVILLVVAGNETIRNAMTHGMNAFFGNPGQRERFKKERPPTSAMPS
jgi:cytochrome P450